MAGPYANGSVSATIAELRQTLVRLEQEKTRVSAAIAALEALNNEPEPEIESSVELEDNYENMSFIDAVRKRISDYGPQTTRQIAEGLIDGNFQSSSQNFVNTAGTMLRRYIDVVVSRNGRWELA